MNEQCVYVGQPAKPINVMLKIVCVFLHGPWGRLLNTYAMLDESGIVTVYY